MNFVSRLSFFFLVSTLSNVSSSAAADLAYALVLSTPLILNLSLGGVMYAISGGEVQTVNAIARYFWFLISCLAFLASYLEVTNVLVGSLLICSVLVILELNFSDDIGGSSRFGALKYYSMSSILWLSLVLSFFLNFDWRFTVFILSLAFFFFGKSAITSFCRWSHGLGDRCMALMGGVPASLVMPTMLAVANFYKVDLSITILVLNTIIGLSVFLMGNFFTYYGKKNVPLFHMFIVSKSYTVLFFSGLVCWTLLYFGFLVGLEIVSYFKIFESKYNSFLLCGLYAISAFGVILSQWLSAIFISNGKTKEFFYVNCLYLLMSVFSLKISLQYELDSIVAIAIAFAVASLIRLLVYLFALRNGFGR